MVFLAFTPFILSGAGRLNPSTGDPLRRMYSQPALSISYSGRPTTCVAPSPTRACARRAVPAAVGANALLDHAVPLPEYRKRSCGRFKRDVENKCRLVGENCVQRSPPRSGVTVCTFSAGAQRPSTPNSSEDARGGRRVQENTGPRSHEPTAVGDARRDQRGRTARLTLTRLRIYLDGWSTGRRVEGHGLIHSKTKQRRGCRTMRGRQQAGSHAMCSTKCLPIGRRTA